MTRLTAGTRLTAPTRPLRSNTLYNYIRNLPNLVAYYPLDETSGNAINHALPTIGTLNGTVTGATQGVAGQMGRAYSFDESNDDITIADNAVFNGETGFDTVSIFFIAKVNSLDGNFLCFTSKGASLVEIMKHDGGKLRIEIATVGGVTKGDTDDVLLSTSAFKFIEYRYDGSEHKIFVNNVQQDITFSDGPETGKFKYGTSVLHIGNRGGSELWNDPVIQHIAFMSRCLTDAESLRITQLAGLA